MEQVYRFFEAYPTLGGMLITLVAWPTLTGLISFAQDELARRYPRVWDVVQRSGFDALGLIRARWPRRLPPPPAGPRPPSAPPPLPPMLLLCLALAGCVPLLGCGSPLRALIVTTDAAAVAGEAARPVVLEVCTVPAEALVARLDAANRAGNVDAARAVRLEAEELAAVCEPVGASLRLLLRLHAAARSAIVAYHATGGPPPGIAGLVVELAAASMDLRRSLARLEGGK